MNQKERSVSMYSEYKTAANATKFEFGVQSDKNIFFINTAVDGEGSGGGNGGGSGGGGGGGGNGGGSK